MAKREEPRVEERGIVGRKKGLIREDVAAAVGVGYVGRGGGEEEENREVESDESRYALGNWGEVESCRSI